MDGAAPIQDKQSCEQRLAPQQRQSEDTFEIASPAAAQISSSERSVGSQQNSDNCSFPSDFREPSASYGSELGPSSLPRLSVTDASHSATDSCCHRNHSSVNSESEQEPHQSPSQADTSCEICCECGECHRDPFTDAVNQSVEKCLDNKGCSFDRPNGEGLASCCMSCGASNAMSRCSRCRQVRYCGRSCQETDWETHQHFCQTLRSQEIQQTFQSQMEKYGADKTGLQPFIVSMRAEIESALHAEDTLKAGFAQLFLSGALSSLDNEQFEAETALMCAADAGKEAGDWKLEQQALQGLVAQRKQWDINGPGATAVSKLLDRSKLKQDVFAEQAAATHCGILQTYTDLLSGPHSDDKTQQIFESGLNFFHQSIGMMFDIQRSVCKMVEDFPDPKAAAGAARLMHMMNFGMCGTCPHVALSWMEQSRHDNLVQLYRANMNKGDRASADQVLAALDIRCSGPEHGAYVKACIANGNENDLHTLDQMLFAGKHINGADSHFGRLSEPLKEPHNPMPGSQAELLSLPAGVDHDLAVRLMEMLRSHNLLPDMPFPDLLPPDGSGPPAPQ
ncbi:hypothetical protein WJX74_001313 [Apatococcus lobatus]|uniref:MYND-type domain-containing protein n=1 Tax=Apatococcus lobatus TaxID=904363 RepID=A0AAW1SEE9_9CHLO